MKLLLSIAVVVMLAVACATDVPTRAPTVAPGATPDLSATVEIRVAETIAAVPTPAPTATPLPLPTATPVPTPTAPAEPTATPVPTATPRATPAPSPFPLLNPRVAGVRFFESGCDASREEPVLYTNVFDQRTSRCIYWQLNLVFDTQPERADFEIDAVYHGPRSGVWARHTANAVVEKGWTNSQYATGEGWPQPGNWETGDYLVELFVGNRLIASAGFAVTELPEPPTVQAAIPRQGLLQTVQGRGNLICAGRDDVPGWGYDDAAGNSTGFDIDLCRAVAAAVLGDPNAIEIRLITAAERGPTIESGEVDMMVRTVTWTSSRDARWGTFAPIMFYDGQGFMVRKALGISSALELQNATVCVVSHTTTDMNLQDYSHRNGLSIEVLALGDTESAILAYENGECSAYTNDHSQLAPIRSFVLANPDIHVILPEFISEEPLAPVVPHGDEQWSDIVRTVMGILIWSEVYGITSDTVPTVPTYIEPIDRLFGLTGFWGQKELGLSRTAAQDVIEAVGNYGEIYKRNLGADGLGLVRNGTRNALWEAAPCSECPKGGQIYAPPLR